MNPKNFSIIALFVAFLVGFRGVVHFGSPRVSGPADPVENERLEATHAWQALRWYNDQRAYPTGNIPADWRGKGLAQGRRDNLWKKTPAKFGDLDNMGATSNAAGGGTEFLQSLPTTTHLYLEG